MVVDVHPLTLEDRSIEIDLHDPDTHPEHVVIQVAARRNNKNTITNQLTNKIGIGDASALLNATDKAIPVMMTAQLVVVSRRFRQTLL